jgi:hypothetical protein
MTCHDGVECGVYDFGLVTVYDVVQLGLQDGIHVDRGAAVVAPVRHIERIEPLIKAVSQMLRVRQRAGVPQKESLLPVVEPHSQAGCPHGFSHKTDVVLAGALASSKQAANEA